MKNINNKGFTLVELLAVIVILVIVTIIAVPNISTSVEKAKSKETEEKNKNLEFAVELYLSDNKDKRTNFYNGSCYINIDSDLMSQGNEYIMKDELSNDDSYVIYKNNKVSSTSTVGSKPQC